MSQTPEEPIRIFASEADLLDDGLLDELEHVSFVEQPTSADLMAALDAWADSRIEQENLVALHDLDRERLALLRTAWPELPEEIRIAVASRADDLQDEVIGFIPGRFFTYLLDDPSPQVRALAVAGLAGEGNAPSTELILDRMLHDTSNDVRTEAAAALEYWALQHTAYDRAESELAYRVSEALIVIARSVGEPWHLRGRALESAAAYGVDSRVVSLIDEFYAEDETGLRYSAIYAMGNSGDSVWLPLLVSELESDDAAAKQAAADALGLIADPESVPALRRLIEDETADVRHAAIRALGNIPSPAARRILNEMAEDPLPEDADVISDALDLGLGGIDDLDD
jgi:hypothetical protein